MCPKLRPKLVRITFQILITRYDHSKWGLPLIEAEAVVSPKLRAQGWMTAFCDIYMRARKGCVAMSSTFLTTLLVSPVALLQHDLPGCLAMALLLDSAPEAQGVITETYKDLDILVPEALREYSKELFENQKGAIDLGALLGEDVNSPTINCLTLG
jgi:hypothetical protein